MAAVPWSPPICPISVRRPRAHPKIFGDSRDPPRTRRGEDTEALLGVGVTLRGPTKGFLETPDAVPGALENQGPLPSSIGNPRFFSRGRQSPRGPLARSSSSPRVLPRASANHMGPLQEPAVTPGLPEAPVPQGPQCTRSHIPKSSATQDPPRHVLVTSSPGCRRPQRPPKGVHPEALAREQQHPIGASQGVGDPWASWVGGSQPRSLPRGTGAPQGPPKAAAPLEPSHLALQVRKAPGPPHKIFRESRDPPRHVGDLREPPRESTPKASQRRWRS
ncbi:basic salivary proline-rich protein 1-like [Homarus americanus]|uniref:basic salivary proline-rich protein 1-like n=1 Tax=Homarus americanus TaxID=6706 RepID=UPI001C441BD9|nr:basic salivary proline-rich protein 1-like [Homarus americanus]